MEIDRRDLLTCLAASIAAAALPSLPARVVCSGLDRFNIVDGAIISDAPQAPDVVIGIASFVRNKQTPRAARRPAKAFVAGICILLVDPLH
jgi:hypothetical protein